MPRLTTSLPKYRKHKASGQARVTLDGMDFYLGPMAPCQAVTNMIGWSGVWQVWSSCQTKKRVVVISAHFKSRGFVGSPEDSLRIQQAEQLIGEIKWMREGVFGDTAKDAPVVLIGNYNLVGSRTPLDKLNNAGQTDLLLRFPTMAQCTRGED